MKRIIITHLAARTGLPAECYMASFFIELSAIMHPTDQQLAKDLDMFIAPDALGFTAMHKYKPIPTSGPAAVYTAFRRNGWTKHPNQYVTDVNTLTEAMATKERLYTLGVRKNTQQIGQLAHDGTGPEATAGCWLPDYGVTGASWKKPQRVLFLSRLYSNPAFGFGFDSAVPVVVQFQSALNNP